MLAGKIGSVLDAVCRAIRVRQALFHALRQAVSLGADHALREGLVLAVRNPALIAFERVVLQALPVTGNMRKHEKA